MDFLFSNKIGNLQKLDIKVGDKWADKTLGNNLLNSIFSCIDDKDGIIEEREISLLSKLFERADNLVHATLGDKHISNKELEMLNKQITNKKININDLKTEHLIKVDKKNYTLDAIRQRYPEDKFEIIDDKMYVMVKNKSTGQYVLNVVYDGDDLHIIEKGDKDRGNLSLICDLNGVVRYYVQDNARKNAVADLLYKSLCAKDEYGLPTTSSDFLNNVKNITPGNVEYVIEFYEEEYNQSLEDAIKEEWGLNSKTKSEALGHIECCYEKSLGYKTNFKNNNSQVSNENYKGAIYSVVQRGDTITVTNKNTNKVYKIDMNMLTKELTIDQRVQFKCMLQNLPAEVLADVALELENSITKKEEKDSKYSGIYYGGFYDSISLVNMDNYLTFIHELGHSVDYLGKYYSTSSINDNAEFARAFESEMNAYLAQGGKKYVDADENQKQNIKDTTSNRSSYATKNEREMFAECYTLLMNGNCGSDELILKHFPKTLEAVKKHIAYVRSLDEEVR